MVELGSRNVFAGTCALPRTSVTRFHDQRRDSFHGPRPRSPISFHRDMGSATARAAPFARGRRPVLQPPIV